jgi:hypothetical protein
MRYVELEFKAHTSEATAWTHDAEVPIAGDIQGYGFVFDYTVTGAVSEGEEVQGLITRKDFQVNGDDYDTMRTNELFIFADLFGEGKHSDLSAVTTVAHRSSYYFQLPKCRESATSMNYHFELRAATSEFVTPATAFTATLRPYVIYGPVRECYRLTRNAYTSVAGVNTVKVPTGKGPIRYFIGWDTTDNDTTWLDVKDGTDVMLFKGSGSLARAMYAKEGQIPTMGYPQASANHSIDEATAGAHEWVHNIRSAKVWTTGKILMKPKIGQTVDVTQTTAEAKVVFWVHRYATITYNRASPDFNETLLENGLAPYTAKLNQ